MNLPGVAKVGAMMTDELRALGFTVTWKPLPQTGRAGHIIATHKGKAGARRLLLLAIVRQRLLVTRLAARQKQRRKPLVLC